MNKFSIFGVGGLGTDKIMGSKANYIMSFSFISFRCNKGYALKGDKESFCLANGSWSHSPPVCEPIKCPSPENISYGKYILSGLTYLSTASYSCESGYR